MFPRRRCMTVDTRTHHVRWSRHLLSTAAEPDRVTTLLTFRRCPASAPPAGQPAQPSTTGCREHCADHPDGNTCTTMRRPHHAQYRGGPRSRGRGRAPSAKGAPVHPSYAGDSERGIECLDRHHQLCQQVEIGFGRTTECRQIVADDDGVDAPRMPCRAPRSPIVIFRPSVKRNVVRGSASRNAAMARRAAVSGRTSRWVNGVPGPRIEEGRPLLHDS